MKLDFSSGNGLEQMIQEAMDRALLEGRRVGHEDALTAMERLQNDLKQLLSQPEVIDRIQTNLVGLDTDVEAIIAQLPIDIGQNSALVNRLVMVVSILLVDLMAEIEKEKILRVKSVFLDRDLVSGDSGEISWDLPAWSPMLSGRNRRLS